VDHTDLEQDSAPTPDGDAAPREDIHFDELIDTTAPAAEQPLSMEVALERATRAQRVLEAPEEDSELRVALLGKADLLALLTVKTSADGGIICRRDPRVKGSEAQIYETAQDARHWFKSSLRGSKENEWTIHYIGPPLRG
jgi:hypothetical protein